MKRVRLSPAEGWSTLALLLLMALVVGFAIDERAWVLGRDSLTDFLPWAAIGGVLAGFVTAELGWGRLRAHTAGAIAAALVVPIIVGSVLLPAEGDFGRLYNATASAATQAVIDLIVRGRGSTQEYGHFLLVLGLLLWATGQFAGYAVFGHRRPVPAVVALGTMLVVEMTLNQHDQLWLLVVFSVAALLLLVRLHVVDERSEWLRRRIGDPGPLATITARAGVVFVSIAIIGAMALTTSARSSPLEGAWTGAEGWLVDVGRGLSKYFSFLSNPRGPTIVDFGPSANIGQTWTSDPAIALRVTLPAGEKERFYWRAATYDEFTGSGWIATDETRQDRPASSDLLVDTMERTLGPQGTGGSRQVTVTIAPDGYHGTEVLAPGAPLSLTVDGLVNLSGESGFLTSVETDQREPSYSVTSEVQLTGDKDPLAITANKLRAAGTDYPPEIMGRYLQVPPGAVGLAAKSVLAQAEQIAQADAAGRGESRTPYDLAAAMVALLHDEDEFTYSADISDVDCRGESVVECFSRVRRGFCQYYASTAAILLREAKIPTRLVQGFLPGELDGNVEVVRNSASHAWIEVYFPTYGWVMFDPTGSALSANAPVLPEGQPVAKPSPTPTRSTGPDDGADPSRPIPSTGAGGGTSGGPGGPGSGPFILIAIVLAGAIGWLAFSAYRRAPRETTPDTAWRSVTGIAGRLGFGPRPTQTVYEYSASLGDVLPAIRPELDTVARAKVEVAYGHHQLGEDRLRAVRLASGRLRVGLLRLVLRRGRRRKR
jgi:transglutaminase-like putative cysteine protease